jgi:hypothetical protein
MQEQLNFSLEQLPRTEVTKSLADRYQRFSRSLRLIGKFSHHDADFLGMPALKKTKRSSLDCAPWNAKTFCTNGRRFIASQGTVKKFR